MTVRSLLLEERYPATVLYTLCLKTFGSEFHEWEPETIWMELQDEFKVDPVDSNKDKIISAVTLVTSNSFYEDFRVFEAVCKGLNGESGDLEWLTPLTPEEVTWAVVESRILDSTPEDFSLEVATYTAETLRLGGIYHCPKPLTFCQLSAKYPMDKYIPLEFRDRVELFQKVKLKKIEAYCALQKEYLSEGLTVLSGYLE